MKSANRWVCLLILSTSFAVIACEDAATKGGSFSGARSADLPATTEGEGAPTEGESYYGDQEYYGDGYYDDVEGEGTTPWEGEGADDYYGEGEGVAEGEGNLGQPGQDPNRDEPVEFPNDDLWKVIEEADIYKVHGDRLFIANPFEGLIIIDLADVAKPKIAARVPLAGRARELYFRDDFLILLVDYENQVNDPSRAVPPDIDSGSGVVVAEAVPGQPVKIHGHLTLPGQIVDSRMLDTNVFIALERAAECSPFISATRAEETHLVSVTVADAANPHLDGELVYAGKDWQVAATSEYFLLAGKNGATSQLHAVVLGASGGLPWEKATYQLGGAVLDRFKMDVRNGYLRVITYNETTQVTALEIYDLNGTQRTPVSNTVLAEHESLHATRFAGARIYAVTYGPLDQSQNRGKLVVPGDPPMLLDAYLEQVAIQDCENAGGWWVPTGEYEGYCEFPQPPEDDWGGDSQDPLWVIDAADPRHPVILAGLVLPGWSTHLVPVGNTLVGLGVDNTNGTEQVAVSLFDITDPTQPNLLGSASFGAGASTSEAYDDFKAFKVFNDEELMLIPFAGVNPQTGERGQFLQLLDFDGQSIKVRGSVPSIGAVRRSWPQDDQLLLLSDRQFQVLKISNRDQPAQTARIDFGARMLDFAVFGGQGLRLIDTGEKNSYRLELVPADEPNIGEPNHWVQLQSATAPDLVVRQDRLYVGATPVIGDGAYLLQRVMVSFNGSNFALKQQAQLTPGAKLACQGNPQAQGLNLGCQPGLLDGRYLIAARQITAGSTGFIANQTITEEGLTDGVFGGSLELFAIDLDNDGEENVAAVAVDVSAAALAKPFDSTVAVEYLAGASARFMLLGIDEEGQWRHTAPQTVMGKVLAVSADGEQVITIDCGPAGDASPLINFYDLGRDGFSLTSSMAGHSCQAALIDGKLFALADRRWPVDQTCTAGVGILTVSDLNSSGTLSFNQTIMTAADPAILRFRDGFLAVSLGGEDMLALWDLREAGKATLMALMPSNGDAGELRSHDAALTVATGSFGIQEFSIEP